MLLFLATSAFPDPFSLLLSAAELLKSVACRVFTVSNFSPKPTPIRLSLGVAQAFALRAGWTKASRAPGSCQHQRRPPSSRLSGTGNPRRPLLTCGSMSSSVPHEPRGCNGKEQGAGAPGTGVLSPAREAQHARSRLRQPPTLHHTRHF